MSWDYRMTTTRSNTPKGFRYKYARLPPLGDQGRPVPVKREAAEIGTRTGRNGQSDGSSYIKYS